MYSEGSFILSFRILFIPTWHTPNQPSWGFRTAHDTSRILQSTKREAREDQALIPTTIPWDGNHSIRPCKQTQGCISPFSTWELQLCSSSVPWCYTTTRRVTSCISRPLQGTQCCPSWSQLTQGWTPAANSAKLIVGNRCLKDQSCVPISLAKGLISRLPEEEVGQGELIQCMQMQEEQETQS